MSSTNRGGQRIADDFYATPAWATAAMLKSPAAWHVGLVIEPSCGDGAVLDVLKERISPDAFLLGFDISHDRISEARSKGYAVKVADFLTISEFGGEPVWIVGNPPYSLAQEFVEHALSIIPDGSRVTFLLRLAFIASQKRAHLYEDGAGFRYLQVLPKRPSFTPDGKTDSSDYAWFTWEKGYTGEAVVSRLGGAS